MDTYLNILLAEDNEDDVFLLQQAFRKAAVSSQLQTVTDGFEVLAYLSGEGIYADRAIYPFPDILLLDLNMPRKNGFEVLEWLRQKSPCPRLVVHVLSSSCRAADVRRVYDLHANSYIMKPTRIEDLIGFVTAMHQWHRFAQFPPQPEQWPHALSLAL